MPEKTVKRRLQDCDAALASDDGPIFSTEAEREGGPRARQSKAYRRGNFVVQPSPRADQSCDRFGLTKPWSRETVLLTGSTPAPPGRET
jgi:hypothetical protein